MMLDASAGDVAGSNESPACSGTSRLPVGYSQAEFDLLVDRFLAVQSSGRRKPDAAERARTADALLAILVCSSYPLPPLPVPSALVELHDAATRAWGIRPGGTVVAGAARDTAGDPTAQSPIAHFIVGDGVAESARDSNSRLAVEAVRFVRALIDRQRTAR